MIYILTYQSNTDLNMQRSIKKYKGVLLFTGLIFLLITVLSCQRVKESHFPDGTIKSRQEFKGKKEHGISTWYFDNGSKELEMNYHEGVPQGLMTRWYYSGQKELQEQYKEGKKNGPSLRWDIQGRLIEEVNFRDDSLHGEYIQYYENGLVKIEGYYKMGKFDSTWTYYNISGMKVGDGKYENGSGIQRAYYPNGRIRLIVPYKNNQRNGYEITLSQDGKETGRVLFKNDIPVNIK
ncbi:MAG TPA: toxin-antitoxin system YwqK family antitoxin [Lentimicrobium sp.]|nr:toxin-antitoxin system YwqK family antitoxin [Lentimicrobium sp.]